MKNKISKKIILELIELFEMKIKELGNVDLCQVFRHKILNKFLSPYLNLFQFLYW